MARSRFMAFRCCSSIPALVPRLESLAAAAANTLARWGRQGGYSSVLNSTLAGIS